jgi:hypothetical protein
MKSPMISGTYGSKKMPPSPPGMGKSPPTGALPATLGPLDRQAVTPLSTQKVKIWGSLGKSRGVFRQKSRGLFGKSRGDFRQKAEGLFGRIAGGLEGRLLNMDL